MSTLADYQKNFKKIVFIIAILVSGGFITMFSETVLTPALPSIMEETSVSTNVAQWLTTGFILVSAIMIPLTAFFINRFPTKRLFMSAMSLFAFGCLLCAISPNFSVILLGRFFQAAGAGIMMPLCQTVVLVLVPLSKRGTAMGVIGLVMALAPAIGPTLAGWVIDIMGWHIMFYIITALAVLDIVLAGFVLENVIESSNPKLDMPSVLLSSLGLASFLYGCSAAGDMGLLHVLPWFFILIGIVTSMAFVKRQFTLKEPFLDLRILKFPQFAIATIIAMIVNAALISGAVMLPIFMQNIQGFSAMQSGLAMLPGALCMAVMNVVSGRIFDKYGPRGLAISGLSLLTISAAAFIFMHTGTPFALLCLIYTMRMVGISMAMMPITTWGLNTLSNKRMAHGTAINNTLRQVAGSIGTTFFVAIMTSFASLRPNDDYITANLYGIQISFTVITLFCLAALVLSIIFVKQTKSQGVIKMKKTQAKA
ncbi:MAG: multidrug efflux MFS transporter [Peptococcaceae bacterium]|jgi:EmrB/QacA subfamily drug resistance transporter|nr:multidrug efflux MFS transporter [Peptococcaceae bacterium]